MNSFICIEVGGYCQGYGYHIPNSSWLNLGRTHHIPCPIRKQPADIGGVPDKERQPEFYMETTRTTRIVSILVSLVLLGQGDTYGYKYKAHRRKGDTLHGSTYKPTYAKTRRRISTSGISTASPLRCLRILSGETKALSLISPSTDSRRKTTLLSTTSQTFRPPCRQQLDRLPQILYWCDYGE